MTFYVCIWSFVIFQCCLEGYKWYDHCNFFPINWTSAIVILPLVSTGSAHVLVATRDQDHLRLSIHAYNAILSGLNLQSFFLNLRDTN